MKKIGFFSLLFLLTACVPNKRVTVNKQSIKVSKVYEKYDAKSQIIECGSSMNSYHFKIIETPSHYKLLGNKYTFSSRPFGKNEKFEILTLVNKNEVDKLFFMNEKDEVSYSEGSSESNLLFFKKSTKVGHWGTIIDKYDEKKKTRLKFLLNEHRLLFEGYVTGNGK